MLKITKKFISVMFAVMLSFSFAVSVNADSENDSRYTIVLQSTTKEDNIYSATAEMESTGTIVSAYFEDITADTYNVLVYYLNVEGGNNSLCTSTQWTSEAAEGETYAIKVDYSIESEKIDVMVTGINNSVSYETSVAQDEVSQSSNQEEKQESNVELQQNEASSNTGLYITILIVIVVLIIAIILICYLCYHKNKNKIKN